MTRRLLTCAALSAALLLGAGPAGATPGTTTTAAGTPKGKLAREGYHLYGEYCLGCHGANAGGRMNEPPYASGSSPGQTQSRKGGIAPSLQGVGALAADFYLRTGYMPLQHLGLQPSRRRLILNDPQIRALVAYVASFGGPPIPQPKPWLGNISQGQKLFTEHCAGCHQIVGQGGYVTGALPPPLDHATNTEIAEAARIGPYVMPKFSQHAISNRQLDSIIRYVDSTRHPYNPGGWGLGFIGPVPEGLATWFLAMPALIVLCLLLGRRFRRS